MSTDNDVVEKQETELKRPKKYVVILHNDDVTPMDFVVDLLKSVFNMDHATAIDLMFKIHDDGQGIAGVYPYEVSEQKVTEARTLIKLASMQLKVTMQEE